MNSMSELAKSLDKKIQQLKASIEAQQAELAAYENVLEMESAKKASAPKSSPVKNTGIPPFGGSKTELIVQTVKSYGSKGVSPREIDAVFSARNVSHSKNLVYNTLGYLVSNKKLSKREGRYYWIGGESAMVESRLSADGLKRIREGLQKRWTTKKKAEKKKKK